MAEHRLITRVEWGATPSREGPKLTRWEGWILHWRDKVLVGDADGAALMKQAETYHEQSKGWADVAYHVGIDRRGHAYQGRSLGHHGAATWGENATSMAIVFLFGWGELTAEAADTARWVIHTLGPDNGFPARIAGPHSKFGAKGGSTECPGDQIREALEAGIFGRPPNVEPKAPTVQRAHSDAARNGPLIAAWLEELEQVHFYFRGRYMTPDEREVWAVDLVKKVYEQGVQDLSTTSRWFYEALAAGN